MAEDVTWSMDYCFVGDRLDDYMLDDEKKSKAVILVLNYDCKTAFCALQEGKKGPTDGVVKWCTDRF